MLSIFLKKKVSEDQVANAFVSGLFSIVQNGFPLVVELLNNSPEFVLNPKVSENEDDRFVFIVLAGNLKLVSNYFEHYHAGQLKELTVKKIANSMDLTVGEVHSTIDLYQELFKTLNYPSKNTKYGMSKAIFHTYNLYEFQQEYFKNLKTPNPLILKRLNEAVEAFIWDWDWFLNKHKLV